MSIPANIIRKLYDLFPRAADSVDLLFSMNPNGNPRNIVTSLLPDDKIRILDICAGSGGSAIPIARARTKARIMCVDGSVGMLNIFRKRLSRTGIRNISLRKMDASAMSFPDDMFDAAVISLVLHELSKKDVAAVLSEARRALKPDGKLYLTEWDPPASGLLRKLLFRILEMCEPPTFHSFIFQDLKPYMQQQGFVTEREIKCDYSRILICRKEQRNEGRIV